MTHRRGFTLIEILLSVSLLGVFSLLAFRLIGANMDIARATRTANWNTARFDSAVRMLREDVSDSGSIETPRPELLRIRSPGNPPIEWEITGNSLSRSIGPDHRRWDVGQPLHLKVDGAVVLLSVSASDEIAMAPLPRGVSR
jgi:prepilin-type N-terminal cleavage/methylation domain-containing protein